jgi:hypothetical protein
MPLLVKIAAPLPYWPLLNRLPRGQNGEKGGLRRSGQTACIEGFGVGADMGIEGGESYTKLKSVVVNLDGTPNPWVDA